MEGTVKFFNNEKRYGFITPDDGGEDYFVHASGVDGTIKEDDQVTFEVEEGDRGPKAINVKKVK